MIGQTFSHYRILDRLGDSEFPGPLYKAEELESRSLVALRILHSSFGLEERKRLARIAAAASQLKHPNVESFVEIGETEGGELFCCGRFRQGDTLDGWIERGDLAAGDALDIIGQMAKGLSRTHRAGIVHGSLKPEMVKLLDAHQVEIAGFGFAVLAGEGLSVRSGDPVTALAYRSPEQIRGGRPHPRIDVWALGVMLFEMLAGRRPFEGSTAGSLAESILGSDPPPISKVWKAAPSELDPILARALSKEIDQRYQGVVELIRDLAPLAGRVGKPKRGSRVPAAASADGPEPEGAAKPSKGATERKKGARKSPPRKKTGERRAAKTEAPKNPPAVEAANEDIPPAAPVQDTQGSGARPSSPGADVATTVEEAGDPVEDGDSGMPGDETTRTPVPARASMQWVLYGGGLLFLILVLGWLLGGF